MRNEYHCDDDSRNNRHERSGWKYTMDTKYTMTNKSDLLRLCKNIEVEILKGVESLWMGT